MATTRDLSERVSALFSARVSTCSNTYKRLQAAQMVSLGGRGRNAPSISAKDCTLLVFALLGSEHINDAADAARRYSMLAARHRTALPADDRSDAAWTTLGATLPRLARLGPGHTLGAAVEEIIATFAETPNSGRLVHSISLTIRGPQVSAKITFSDSPAMSTTSAIETMDYEATNARDMFRTVVGNPMEKIGRNHFKRSDLYVEKRITQKTLQGLGELLRDG